MGGKNFMEAGTEIDAMISKKDQCLVKISNILAEACVTRARSGKTNSLETDITNLINSLPAEDQIVILKKLTVTLATQLSGAKKVDNDNEDYRREQKRRNDIFANRSW